jgi:hypothetical protein
MSNPAATFGFLGYDPENSAARGISWHGCK